MTANQHPSEPSAAIQSFDLGSDATRLHVAQTAAGKRDSKLGAFNMLLGDIEASPHYQTVRLLGQLHLGLPSDANAATPIPAIDDTSIHAFWRELSQQTGVMFAPASSGDLTTVGLVAAAIRLASSGASHAEDAD